MPVSIYAIYSSQTRRITVYLYFKNKSMLSMIIDNISSFMYSKLLVIILIGAGVYFTIRTSFPQVRLFHSACKAVMEKRPCSGISRTC